MNKLSILLLTAGGSLFGSTPARDSSLATTLAYTHAVHSNDLCQTAAQACASSLVWGTDYRSSDQFLSASEPAGLHPANAAVADASGPCNTPTVQPGSVVWGTSLLKWLLGLG